MENGFISAVRLEGTEVHHWTKDAHTLMRRHDDLGGMGLPRFECGCCLPSFLPPPALLYMTKGLLRSAEAKNPQSSTTAAKSELQGSFGLLTS